MTDIKIRNADAENIQDAADVARHFIETYPDRIGIYHGCAYSKKGFPSFYAYRTKTSIVVIVSKTIVDT